MHSTVFKAALWVKLAVCWCFAGLCVAATSNDQQLREWFQRAEAIAHRPNSSEFKLLSQRLADYPLAPYVTLKTLRRYPYLVNKGQIQRFLKQHAATPLDKPLRKVWLEYLAEEGQQTLFLENYRDLGDTALTCHWLRFRLNTDEAKEPLFAAVNALWLVGKSQPKACDPLFSEWKKAGNLTESLVYERLKLAANGGKHTLIPYLKKQLPPAKRYLADLWRNVRRDPSYVAKTRLFEQRFPRLENEILIYGLRRLVWRDRQLALSLWDKLKRTRQFTTVQSLRIAERFAVALALHNHRRADEWLQRAVASSQDVEVVRWQLAHTLRQRNWQQVQRSATLGLAIAPKEQVFRYWLARSCDELGDNEAAKEHFAILAKQRHYYGFMASAKLAQPPAMAAQAASVSEQQMAAVLQYPAAQRAFEFLQLQRLTNARREWRYLLRQLSAEQQTTAAVIADSWGWHDEAIRTFSYSGYLNDVKRRFPMAYANSIVKYAKSNNISPAWAFAIARRESAFMPDAKSSVGARGLMQIMPSTAKYLENRRVRNGALYKPEFNIQLGTRYLQYLLGQVDNNPVLATASYNAGWRRVRDWLPEGGDMPLDVWIESIPYKETREYVKAILTYQQIYTWTLDGDTSLFAGYAAMTMPMASSL